MTIRLDNWHARRVMADPYTPPELHLIELVGNVSGHPRFDDGAQIATGPIREVEGRQIVTARRTYTLGEPKADYVAWLAEIGKPYDPERPVRMVGGAA